MISDTVYVILNIIAVLIISSLLCVLMYQIYVDWNTPPRIMRHEYIPTTLKMSDEIKRSTGLRVEIPVQKLKNQEIRKWI